MTDTPDARSDAPLPHAAARGIRRRTDALPMTGRNAETNGRRTGRVAADTEPTDAELEAFEAAQRAPKPRLPRWMLVVASILIIVVVGLVAFSVGRLSTLADPTPTQNSAEAGFSRDMQLHHDQGVELAFLIRDRSTSDDIRTLAYDIAFTQANQSGQMLGWLQSWGLPAAASEPSMTWMTRPTLEGASHAHGGTSTDAAAHEPGAPMPGLATPAQIQQLTDATGTDAEKIFLTLMIAHHKGAIEMADAVLERSTNTAVTKFARGVVSSQESEIGLMEDLLAKRGG